MNARLLRRKPTVQSAVDAFSSTISQKPLLRDTASQTGMSMRYKPRRVLSAAATGQLLALTLPHHLSINESALGQKSESTSHPHMPHPPVISTYSVEMSKTDGTGMLKNVKISTTQPCNADVSGAQPMPASLLTFVTTALPFLQLFKEAPPRHSAPALNIPSPLFRKNNGRS